MTLSAALLENWIFGKFLCKFVHFTSTLTALISTFTVAVIAIERWFFIVNKQKFDRRFTILTLICLWTISIVIATPEFLARHVQPAYSQSVLQYIVDAYQLTNLNSEIFANITESFPFMQVPCSTHKVFYCVLKTGLRMRVFSYVILTVQYVVPFLFVSVSCYSISRYLKRRMKRMRSYQTRSNSARSTLSHSKHDDFIEHELTSHEDFFSSPKSKIESRSSKNCFQRFFHSFQIKDQRSNKNSIEINDHNQELRSQTHAERRFRRSRKLLICVAALFNISWLPLTIIQIYLDHNEQVLNTRDGANYVYGYLLIPCYLVSSLSSWMNPIIYNYINRSFRREFYALYSCCLPRSFIDNQQKDFQSTNRTRFRPELTSVNERVRLSAQRQSNKVSTPVVAFRDQETILIDDRA